MYKLIKSGPYLYGSSIFLLGVEQFITGNFPVALLPVPSDTPGRLILVYVVGAILVIGGLGIIIQKKPTWASILLGPLFILLDLVIHLPKLIANPYNGGEWTVFTELLALAGGAFLLVEHFSADFSAIYVSRISNSLIRSGLLVYSLSLLIFGIQHILYGQYVATLIPSWIPLHVFWAYFVGIAFLATAISFLSKKLAQLAATLLGVLFTLLVIVLHIPRVVTHLHTETEWTSLLIALAMGGISFTLAASSMIRRGVQ
ncbi:hypothetical protein EXU85_15730 [Spirosoma sp. KCTC 42546]|uniref:hypothetical protein n=1 Tax=Spirosoma sp. KCTC 42546 TaxID=2520506 RepID=UPI001158CE6E|nr:hypothetical protein [Spirosoma sp. KCTC 42546]QDK79981.1 hypothetical protein EXU85_15730 [Spirosoma sp. KCTC 42546]